MYCLKKEDRQLLLRNIDVSDDPECVVFDRN